MSAAAAPRLGVATAPRAAVGGKIRVLVVDDSAVIRRIVTDVLNEDAAIEVVGTASNGRIALEKMVQLRPDLITLDVEMPEVDGLSMLSQLRKQDRKVPVIMFSSLTERAASVTVEALARGASDYVTKPSGSGNLAAAMASVRAELLPKVKALCAPPGTRPPGGSPPGSHTAAPTAPGIRPSVDRLRPATGPSVGPRSAVAGAGIASGAAPAAPTSSAPHSGPASRVDVVAIGVSTGGPNALAVLLPSLRNLAVPILIVQHMPALFTKLLAEQLTNSSGIPVSEATHGMQVVPGRAYVAPGDHHMVAVREGTSVKLLLNQDPPENSCRPAVDVMFRSVATLYGANTLAIVLTGMGSDGEKGAAQIRKVGGQILAQDEASSVVWGMPGAVARAGLADQILPLADLGPQIVSRVNRQRGR